MSESPEFSRNVYLHDVALSEAVAAWHAALEAADLLVPRGVETLPLVEAHGRVTAAAVWARISSPHYHAAAMDGYAVRSEETRGASETRPLRLQIGDQAVAVDTGDPLPTGMNTVIMIEETQLIQQAGEKLIEILAAAPPWSHVRPMGEDIVATELVLPANHRLRPQDLGALAGSGHTTVTVYRRPRIAILPTGTELVPPGSELQPGDIIEYNSLMLGAQAEEAGCDVTRLPIVVDNYAALKAAVRGALVDHDLVVINAGSSAGSEDFTSTLVAELGTLCVHGIAIRPGHPVVLGVAEGKALVGIPGYPVSASVTFDLLVKPLLYRWQGVRPPERPVIDAVLTRKVLSGLGEDHFLRVTVGKVGERFVATPLTGGAGVLMSLVKADGVVTIPRFAEGHPAGATVQVELLRPLGDIRRNIVIIGSHDMTLDLLADQLRRQQPDMTLSSAHVGSLGGLLALQRGEAHLAGSHLLDEATGDYNLGTIQRLLTAHGIPVVLLGFVEREQGLILPKGNPKAIMQVEDLLRNDVTFVNRQRGAGTRVLLDYVLGQRGLDPAQINGYARQEYTHLAVAAAVKSGAADCGLGILAAARSLDLDFVPLMHERYDLVIPQQYYADALLAPLLTILRDPTSPFRRAVQELGGYATPRMGEVLAEL
jgi:putative molybdopterin biosynthesis protein